MLLYILVLMLHYVLQESIMRIYKYIEHLLP